MRAVLAVAGWVGRGRWWRRLLFVGLLLAAAGFVLGGQTAERVGRVRQPDGLVGVGGEVVAHGVAVPRRCERQGPVSGAGFGYAWACLAEVDEEVAPEPGRPGVPPSA